MKRISLLIYLLCAILTCSIVSSSIAYDIPMPKPLKGDIKYVVNRSNADQYKDKMPEGLYQLVKDWGYSLNVYDTVNNFALPQEYIDATEKYKGTARVNKKGGLENYTAGLPFPDPKNGIEVMYNHNYKYSGDDFNYSIYDITAFSSTGKSRDIKGFYSRLSYQGRTIIDPKPSLPNPTGIEVKELSGYSAPEDVAGLTLILTRYQDPDKGDDGTMYVPSIRRMRRISVAQRGDTSAGLDYTWDDYKGFAGKVSDYNWTLLGKKELLMPYHSPTSNFKFTNKMIDPGTYRYELRTVYVVDGVNKDKNYVYSKRRIYLDADSLEVNSYQVWDRKGSLWKYGELNLIPDPKQKILAIANHSMYDLIAKRSSHAYNVHQSVNIGLKEDFFSATRIQTLGR